MDLSKLDLNPFVPLTRDRSTGKSAQKLNVSKTKVNKTVEKQKLKPQTRSKLECYFCEKTFPKAQTQRLAGDLTTTHTKEEPYKCSHCKSRFKTQRKLNHHNLEIHTKERFKCPHCEKTFFYKDWIKNHIDAIHRGILYECPICERSFNSKSHMTRHVRTIHENIRNHSCSFCPKQFSCTPELNLHMNAVHFKQKDLTKCPDPGCNLTFNNKTSARRHRSKCHPRPDVDKLKCKLCDKIFAFSCDLSTHRKYTHGSNNSRFQCPLCQKSYKQNISLRGHTTSAHTAKTPFKCDREKCQKDFALSFQLRLHKVRHLDMELGRKYTCAKCPSFLKHKDLLDKHNRKMHTGR